MISNTSEQAFVSALSENFVTFKTDMDNFMGAIASSNALDKKRIGLALLQSGNVLRRMLIPDDQPAWLVTTINSLNSYVNSLEDYSCCALLNKSLARQYLLCLDHKWSFAKTDSSGIDFDAIFIACRDSGRLPDLFDDLVSILDQLLQSGEIDSLRVTEALKKISNTLKKNRKGSYFATFGSKESVVELLQGWVLTELEKIPLLGGLITALREKVGETEQEFVVLNSTIRDEVKKQMKIELRSLEFRPQSTGLLSNESAISGTPDVSQNE